MHRDSVDFVAVFRVGPSGDGVERSLVDMFERSENAVSWSRVSETDPRRGWPCEKMFLARAEAISLRMRGSADLAVSGSKLELLLDDGTRSLVEGAHIRGFSQPRDYSGTRATWDDVSLYETEAALVVAVTRVFDWQGGLDRTEVDVFVSTDRGRTWARSQNAPTGMQPSARYCSYEPFV